MARGGSADAGRAGWLPAGADTAAAALYLFSPLCAGVVRAGGRVAEAACGWLTGDVCRHGRVAQRWWVRPHLPRPPVPMRLQVLEQHLVVEALWLAADGVRRCAVMACAHGLSSAAQAGVAAGAALGAAAYVGLHPAALLPAVALQAPAGRRAAVVAGFVAAAMALVAASAAARGGWGWVDRVYGAMVRADDLTPNVGLWWYLMIEVFAPFRLLKLRVLHGVLWLMAPPIAVAHRGNAPLVSAVAAVAAAMAGGGLNALARPDGCSAARHRGPAEALPDGGRLWAHRGLPSCGEPPLAILLVAICGWQRSACVRGALGRLLGRVAGRPWRQCQLLLCGHARVGCDAGGSPCRDRMGASQAPAAGREWQCREAQGRMKGLWEGCFAVAAHADDVAAAAPHIR